MLHVPDGWRLSESRGGALNNTRRLAQGPSGVELSSDSSSSDSWVAREACKIYTWDVANATNNHLLPRYVPKHWLGNKFSAEMWIHRAVRSHPWRTHDSSQADVVHLAANFSMYCRAGKLYSARFVWRALLPLLGYTGKPTALLRPPQLPGTERTPKLTVLTLTLTRALTRTRTRGRTLTLALTLTLTRPTRRRRPGPRPRCRRRRCGR